MSNSKAEKAQTACLFADLKGKSICEYTAFDDGGDGGDDDWDKGDDDDDDWLDDYRQTGDDWEADSRPTRKSSHGHEEEEPGASGEQFWDEFEAQDYSAANTCGKAGRDIGKAGASKTNGTCSTQKRPSEDSGNMSTTEPAQKRLHSGTATPSKKKAEFVSKLHTELEKLSDAETRRKKWETVCKMLDDRAAQLQTSADLSPSDIAELKQDLRVYVSKSSPTSATELAQKPLQSGAATASNKKTLFVSRLHAELEKVSDPESRRKKWETICKMLDDKAAQLQTSADLSPSDIAELKQDLLRLYVSNSGPTSAAEPSQKPLQSDTVTTSNKKTLFVSRLHAEFGKLSDPESRRTKWGKICKMLDDKAAQLQTSADISPSDIAELKEDLRKRIP